jgi:hypothetical protein
MRHARHFGFAGLPPYITFRKLCNHPIAYHGGRLKQAVEQVVQFLPGDIDWRDYWHHYGPQNVTLAPAFLTINLFAMVLPATWQVRASLVRL